MTRTRTIALVAVVVVGTLAWVPAPGLADSNVEQAETNASVAPGTQLTGVVAVQEAEIEGEIEVREFVLQVRNAESNESVAEILESELANLQNKTESLAERKQELKQARENGSISKSEYRAEMAKLHVESKTVRTLANASANVSEGLPEKLLEEKGINVTAIQRLKTNANNLTGPQVARIARSIAGPNVGQKAVGKNAPAVAANMSKHGFNQSANATQGGPGQGPGAQGNETAPPETGNATDGGERGGTGADGSDERGGNDNGGTGGQPALVGVRDLA